MLYGGTFCFDTPMMWAIGCFFIYSGGPNWDSVS